MKYHLQVQGKPVSENWLSAVLVGAAIGLICHALQYDLNGEARKVCGYIMPLST